MCDLGRNYKIDYLKGYLFKLVFSCSSISELDFIKKIVERVDFTLTKISSKDKNSPETSKVCS